jgi:ferredoxin
VKVIDANPAPGGMMRVGIPPHRLQYEQLAWEIDRIVAEGVELQLNTWVDDIPGLFQEGYDAVLAAAGVCRALKPPLENTDHPDNWLSLDFLKRVALGEKIDLSDREVLVLGGGDVAMDSARAALRLGTSRVKIICRGLRASEGELKAAEEEGIEIIRGRVFQKVDLKGKKISGVVCLEAEVGEVVGGKRQFSEIPGTEHLIQGDLVIWALGQKPDSSFLPDEEILFDQDYQVISSDQQGKTPLDGLFAAGDFRLGNTTFVVDAVGEGHQAALAIHHYLMNSIPEDRKQESQVVLLSPDQMQSRLESRKKARSKRRAIPSLAVEDRAGNFLEVDLTLREKDALLESGRCLVCGPCSECMSCVEVCEPGAINLGHSSRSYVVETRAILSERASRPGEGEPGFTYDPALGPMAGSAAAYEVIKELESPQAIPGYRVKPVQKDGAKTGLVLCTCGGEISDTVNTGALRKEAASWPEIDFSAELSYSCTAGGAQELKRMIKENQLNKLVLAACSCCSLDQVCYSCTYQRLRCKENLGVFSSLDPLVEIEFVNIREQCAWAHRRNRKKATDVARSLIRTALAREPAARTELPETPLQPKQVLVVGQGASALSCLGALDELGLKGVSLEVLSGDVVRFGGKYRTQAEQGVIEADCLVLAPGSGAELDHLSGFLKLLNQNILISRERLEIDPGELGLAICPPDLESELSGKAGAGRIYAWIQRTFNQQRPRAAAVDRQRCRSCGTCTEVCGFGIPLIISENGDSCALINPYLCQDCGVCTAHCPSGAISPGTHSNAEMDHLLEMILS